MYYKLQEFLEIEKNLIANGWSKKGYFTWSGDLGYKELRCYTEAYSLKNYISFRWYDKRGNFECLFGYSNNVGLCGGFTKRADITDFINEIGIGRGWIKKVLDNATPNTPDYIIL